MPIPLPDLDSRRWADLVDEARALIPRLAPAWTDHNAHDPGITLIELLAWLAEMDIYRLNRVPDAHRRKFLALVGEAPRDPQAAHSVVALTPTGPAPADVPQGAEFVASTTSGDTTLFRTVEPVTAVPATLKALLVQAGPDVAPRDVTRLLREQGSLAALGGQPVAGAALWLGFDPSLPKDAWIRLAFVFAGGRSGPEERRRIVAEADAQRESCRGPLPTPPPCASPPAGPPSPTATEAPLLHHDARLAWEFNAASGWMAVEVRDDTRALTLDGSALVRLSQDMAPIAVAGLGPLGYLRVRLSSGQFDAPPMLADVAVNGVSVEQSVPLIRPFAIRAGVVADGTAPVDPGKDWFAWRRVRLGLRLDAHGDIDRLAFVADDRAPELLAFYGRLAGTSSPGLLLLDLVPIGSSDGRPDQSFALPKAPVRGDSLELFTLEPDPTDPTGTAWHRWSSRPDFDASRGRDEVVLLDAAGGRVRFGDGDRGRIPPAGVPILVRERTTAAASGNVGAGAIADLAPTLRNWLRLDPGDFHAREISPATPGPLAADPERAWGLRGSSSYQAARARLGPIVQRRPASGGADAEGIGPAVGRAIAALQDPGRAVTIDDYERLALATPGTAVARSLALPAHHPSFPCLVAPGVVTVIVVPDSGAPRPSPSPGLLAAVTRYLRRRRMLGTHVEVVGPSFLTVQVAAKVQSRPGANLARVRDGVTAALDAFLDPLRGGPASPTGPGATVAAPGWPFGRDVYRTEVLQAIVAVAGVDFVLSLTLSGDGGPASCGNLCVGPTELVTPGPHSIEVV